SSGGVLAAAAGLVVFFALDPRRRALVPTVLRLAPPAVVLVAVGVWADLVNRNLAGVDTDALRAALGATVVAAAAASALLARGDAHHARHPVSLPRPVAVALALVAATPGALVTALPELGGNHTLQ